MPRRAPGDLHGAYLPDHDDDGATEHDDLERARPDDDLELDDHDDDSATEHDDLGHELERARPDDDHSAEHDELERA